MKVVITHSGEAKVVITHSGEETKVVTHSDYLDAAYNDVFKGFVSVFRLGFNQLPCFYTVDTYDEYYLEFKWTEDRTLCSLFFNMNR